MPSIKGTSSVADARAMDKLLRTTKFPSNFAKAVNLSKINKPVLVQWMERTITARLGFEDEIVTSTAVNLFLPESTSSSNDGGSLKVDPRRAQLDLVGFLGENEAAEFAKELWEMMLDAQDAPGGIPRKLLEEKKKELAQAKLEEETAAAAAAVQRAHHRSQKRPPQPDVNQYVKEASRRAEAARQALRGDDKMIHAANVPERQRHHPMNGADGHQHARLPAPVSPPHPSRDNDGDDYYDDRRRRIRRESDRDEFGRERRSRDHYNNDDWQRSYRKDREDRGRPEERGRYEDNKVDRRESKDHDRHRRRHRSRDDEEEDSDRDNRRHRRRSEENRRRRDRDEGHKDDRRRERSRDRGDDDERKGGRRSDHGTRGYSDEKRSRKRDRYSSDDDSR